MCLVCPTKLCDLCRVSFSKRKLIYSPINLGFHLLIARIVPYCFLLFTVYHCKCYNRWRFNLQDKKTFYTQAFDSIAESFSSDGFGRFFTWFILWITWQHDSTKDSVMEDCKCYFSLSIHGFPSTSAIVHTALISFLYTYTYNCHLAFSSACKFSGKAHNSVLTGGDPWQSTEHCRVSGF